MGLAFIALLGGFRGYAEEYYIGNEDIIIIKVCLLCLLGDLIGWSSGSAGGED